MKDSTARTMAGAILGILVVLAVLVGSALVVWIFRQIRDAVGDDDGRAVGLILLAAMVVGAVIFRRVDE